MKTIEELEHEARKTLIAKYGHLKVDIYERAFTADGVKMHNLADAKFVDRVHTFYIKDFLKEIKSEYYYKDYIEHLEKKNKYLTKLMWYAWAGWVITAIVSMLLGGL